MTDIDTQADIELHSVDGHVTVSVPLAGAVTGEWLRCYQQLALATEMSAAVHARQDRAWLVVSVPATSDQTRDRIWPLNWVGVGRFELPASSSRTKRAAKLRHTPQAGRYASDRSQSLADGGSRCARLATRARQAPGSLAPGWSPTMIDGALGLAGK